jgi:hypothetical protein
MLRIRSINSTKKKFFFTCAHAAYARCIYIYLLTTHLKDQIKSLLYSFWSVSIGSEPIEIEPNRNFNDSISRVSVRFGSVSNRKTEPNQSVRFGTESFQGVAETESDHEVIEFSINVEDTDTINNSMTKKFNTQKADWNKFNQYFKNNHSSIKNRMSRLLNNSQSKNLNEEAKLLRDVIIKASNQAISKRRSCENSKV